MTLHPLPVRVSTYPVTAHQPNLGMICLRHRCALQSTHAPVSHLPGLLKAERRFRHLHRTRGRVLDSPAMTIARDTALLVDTNDVASQHHDAPLRPAAIMIFPSHVAIAAVITDPTFLTTTCRITTPAPHRKHYTATRIARATGYDPDHIGKALHHLWTILDNLTDYRHAVDTGHRTFTMTAHHHLPFCAGSLTVMSDRRTLIDALTTVGSLLDGFEMSPGDN
jgi:hypothetical protein